MGKVKGFEQLAHELPEDERNELLKELQEELFPDKKNSLESAEAVSYAGDGKPVEDESEGSLEDPKYLGKVYREIPVLEKILMFLTKLLTGKPIEKLVEEFILRKLGREIDADYPGLLDLKNSKLKERFYNEISLLAGSLEVFSDAVAFINKNKPASFYRFVASREMSGFEEILRKETNPESFIKSGETSDPETVRTEVNRKFTEIMDSIEPEEKKGVYEISKSFFYINQLATFPFESFRKMFIIEPNGNRACIFGNARKMLAQLDSIISGMTSEMIQFDRFCDYLFDYYYRKNDLTAASEGDASDNEEYQKKIRKKAVNSVTMVFGFQKTIPLRKILKYMYKNMEYKPARISGGEEWFTLYKKLIKDEIDDKTENFLFRLKRRTILGKLKAHIADIPAAEKDYYILRYNDKTYPLKKCNILYFLNIFHEKYYLEKVEKTVSRIMLDGVFYKDSNRKELNESFNIISSFREVYNNFYQKINADNQAARELSSLSHEDVTVAFRKKKTETIVKNLETEGLRVYKTYHEAYLSIKNIMGGIANGNASGKYDTLSNLSIVCEEKTNMSVQSIDRLYRQLSDILNIFRELEDLDRE